MEKPALFETKQQFFKTIFLLLSLFFLRVGWEYRAYTEFISKPFYFTYATVIDAYRKQKGKRTYQVLKLQSDTGRIFYTIAHRKTLLEKRRLRLQIFPDSKIGFTDFLGGFYVKSRIREVEEPSTSLKALLVEKVDAQHHNALLGSFYNAIFFATPLSKALREKISLLGISHLIALSGFHLGILWTLVYGGVLPGYRFFQQRYFPYRYALFDVGAVAIVLLGIYVWFVGAPPSLLRAYTMIVAGWAMLLMGVELLSFGFLTTIAVALLLLSPALAVSLGFWLSLAGVFYIFLLLQYVDDYTHKWRVTLFLIPVGIFLLMLPLVHLFFGTTSPYQLLSPLLSLLFIPFYPMVMLLHLLGRGEGCDTLLLWLFSLPKTGEEQLLPFGMAVGYLLLSLGAIRFRKAYYLLWAISCGYALYLFV